MKINNIEIYGLEESIVASSYPMSRDIKQRGAHHSDYDRADKLAGCKSGTGHDCFMKGIIVQADVTAPQYWWLQYQRYHFTDIVSSQSKMHRITIMDTEEHCNKYVLAANIGNLKRIIDIYKKEPTDYNFQSIIANCPMGLMLIARISTNYLQLKTIYQQRENHKLEEWHIFCNWIENLRCSEWITGNAS